MALPNVITWSLAASSATALVNAAPVLGPSNFTLATTILDNQRRVLLTFSGNESANSFVITGTNQASFPVTETLAGTNATTSQSNQDFKSVLSIKPLATTAGTVSAGTNGVGSTLWQIMNWHVTPTNIECSGFVTSTSTTVNWGVQYTYDDPNNLPLGVQFPQPFNHPTLQNLTTSLDGPINDPVTGARLIINSGTGVVRGTFIQAGIGSP